MMRINKTTFEKHYDYITGIAPKLIEAERTVDEIKHSKEWKEAYGYFQTLYNRGHLKERPTQKNGYKIIAGRNMVSISDIEDILTEEQLQIIRERIL